jgi:hypothetical protein
MKPRNDVPVVELSLSLSKCKNEVKRVSELLTSFLPVARKELDILFRNAMELTNKQAHNIS